MKKSYQEVINKSQEILRERNQRNNKKGEEKIRKKEKEEIH